MSSGLLESLRRNVGLRLSLLYALIFSVSSVALLALAYYLLAAAVGNKDREVLEARLKAAAVVYQTGGIIGLRSWVASQPDEVQNTMSPRVPGWKPGFHDFPKGLDQVIEAWHAGLLSN